MGTQQAKQLARILVATACAVFTVAMASRAQQNPAPGPMPNPNPPAQRDLPTVSGFTVVPFDFGPPGARSLGMGGAFIALADDATAAEANPAGLTQLSRPELSIHGRHAETTIETFDLNALAALGQLNRQRTFPTNLSANSTVGNAFATETHVQFQPEADEISFASFVKPQDTYTFSIFYQKATNFSGEGSSPPSTTRCSTTTKQGRCSTFSSKTWDCRPISYGADIELAALPPGASLAEVPACCGSRVDGSRSVWSTKTEAASRSRVNHSTSAVQPARNARPCHFRPAPSSASVNSRSAKNASTAAAPKSAEVRTVPTMGTCTSRN